MFNLRTEVTLNLEDEKHAACCEKEKSRIANCNLAILSPNLGEKVRNGNRKEKLEKSAPSRKIRQRAHRSAKK